MGMGPSSAAVDSMQSRAAVAEAALHGGQHQRLLRRAIAATVRMSSRWERAASCLVPVRHADASQDLLMMQSMTAGDKL